MGASLIPLMGQTPAAVNPIQSLGQLLSLRDQTSQIALRQAQTQQANQQAADLQVQAQARQRALQDQTALRQALVDPDHPEYAKQAGKGDYSFMNGRADPTSVNQWTTQTLGQIKEAALTDAETLKNKAALHDEAAKSIDSLALLPPDQRIAAYPGVVNHLKNLPGGGSVNFPASFDGTDASLNQIAALNNVLGEHTKSALALKEQQTTQQKTAAEAANLAAETPGKSAESEKSQLLLNQMKQFIANPQVGENAIDVAIPKEQNAQLNAAYHAEYASAAARGDLAGAQAAITKAVAAAGERAMKLDPTIRSAEVQDAGRKAAEIAPIDIQKSNIQNSQKEYLDSLDTLNTSRAASAQFQRVLDLANAGNQVAGPQLKTMLQEAINSVQGIKRPSSVAGSTELGSAVDRIKGWIGQQNEGKPLDENIRKDLSQVIDSLQTGAVQAHNQRVQSIGQVYHTQYPQEQVPAPKQTTTGHKVGDTVDLKNGKTVTITAIHPDGKGFDAQ